MDCMSIVYVTNSTGGLRLADRKLSTNETAKLIRSNDNCIVSMQLE